MKLLDLAGQRFGRLTVVRRVNNRSKRAMWACLCDCGNEAMISSTHLRSGHTTSCGCAAREAAAARNRRSAKHGMWKTPEFEVWAQMVKRCHSPTHRRFADYGGRGITVCDEWRRDFAAFYANVGPRPSPGHSIERIRNGEGYKPGNVQWATLVEQNNNRRNNVVAMVSGELMTAAQIAHRYGLGHQCVIHRIRAGKTGADLIAPSRRAEGRSE